MPFFLPDHQGEVSRFLEEAQGAEPSQWMLVITIKGQVIRIIFTLTFVRLFSSVLIRREVLMVGCYK